MAISRGGNGVEVVAAAHGQEGSGRREPAISRGAGEDLKVNPTPTPHQILRMLCCRISVGRHDSACQDVHVLELDTVTRY